MVPVVDLSRRGRKVSARFAELAAEVSSSGWYLLGEQTAAFESEFAAWLDRIATQSGPAHVTAVSSGASALQVALAALGVGVGDEVIVPAFTAVPTASAVCAVGATPVPVDVCADTGNLDPELVGGASTPATRAVIAVDLYGRPSGVRSVDLPVIEDAAQAHGAVRDHATPAVVAYSFYPTKNLGGIGDGGAVVTADPDLADKVRRLRSHGMTEMYVHKDISQNFRMSELEAAWLRCGLVALDDDNQRRREIARHYREAAPDRHWQLAHDDHVFHLCVLRSRHRDDFREALAAMDVATAVHYPLAITQQPGYRSFTVNTCPEAEAWAAECVSIPCFPEMTDAEVEHVGRALSRSPR